MSSLFGCLLFLPTYVFYCAMETDIFSNFSLKTESNVNFLKILCFDSFSLWRLSHVFLELLCILNPFSSFHLSFLLFWSEVGIGDVVFSFVVVVPAPHTLHTLLVRFTHACNKTICIVPQEKNKFKCQVSSLVKDKYIEL